MKQRKTHKVREAKLKRASREVNEILNEGTKGWIFTSPGTRALVWFRCYEAQKMHGEKAGYSISRTEARHTLWGYGLDLDEILAEVGLE